MASWLGVPPTIIPTQITIAGTGATVDIVPRIFVNANPPTVGGTALSNTDSVSTTVYTSSSIEAGTYQVVVGFEIENDGTAVAWSTGEQMLFSIGGTGVSTRPLVSIQPAYVNITQNANDPIYFTLSGLVVLTAASTLTCNVIRYGTPSSNKQGSVYLMTVQKIA